MSSSPAKRRRRDELVYGTLALVAGGLLCLWGATGPAEAQQEQQQQQEQPGQPAPPVSAPAGQAPPAGNAPVSNTVRIVFTTVPSAKAMVFWGKRKLGPIAPKHPLIVQRPRDSGPMDLMVRAEGFLPVQTRVYTFADGKIAVKLTPPDQKKSLLGYREPPPPDGGALGATPDGGAPDAGFLP